MGQNFSSEPVVEKETERDQNDTYNVAVSSCQGWRVSQEDNHSLILELPGDYKASFFAVYDGHGSNIVSKHASEELWRHLTENEFYIKGLFKEALETSFLAFDREVNKSYNAQLAGTTAVCVLIVDNKIYCANIGDSRAVASVNCECVPLSYDHKPENPLELKRILAAGGYVLGNRVNGNLALSRAFGDFHYKGNEQLPPEQQIVSPCPDVKILELNDDVDFLVLACDGIWDVLSSEEVVEIVIAQLEKHVEPGTICEQLTTRCLAPDYELVIGCDNMTVLLVCYTRGKSWSDYCAHIYEKNSKRLGSHTRRDLETIEQSLLSPQDQGDTNVKESDTELSQPQDSRPLDDCDTNPVEDAKCSANQEKLDEGQALVKLIQDLEAKPQCPSQSEDKPGAEVQVEGEAVSELGAEAGTDSEMEEEKQVTEDGQEGEIQAREGAEVEPGAQDKPSSEQSEPSEGSQLDSSVSDDPQGGSE